MTTETTEQQPPSWARRLRTERDRRAWSRGDLARKIRISARMLGIDGLPGARIIRGYTHGWESGATLPDWKYQTLLAAVFGLTVRELFGPAAALNIPPMLMAATGGTVEMPYFAKAEDELVQRRKLIAWLAALAAGTAALPDTVRHVITTVADVPDLLPTMTMDDVAELDAANSMFTRWEHQVGGAVARQAARAHVSWAVAQLEGGVPATREVRDAWRVTTARLAQTAGWMSHDAHHEPQARAMLVLGYRVASSVEHAPTGEPARAFMLSQLARQSIDLGRPGTGLEIMNYSQGIAEGVSPTARYRTHAVKACAYGAMGNEPAMRRELGLAEEEYSHISTEDLIRDPWEWDWQHLGQVHYNVGVARQRLANARNEGVTEAQSAAIAGSYISSAAHWNDRLARSRTSARLRAATMLLAGKHHEQAVAVAREALPALPKLRSQRINDDISALRTVAAPFRRRPDVSALVHDLAQVSG